MGLLHASLAFGLTLSFTVAGRSQADWPKWRALWDIELTGLIHAI